MPTGDHWRIVGEERRLDRERAHTIREERRRERIAAAEVAVAEAQEARREAMCELERVKATDTDWLRRTIATAEAQNATGRLRRARQDLRSAYYPQSPPYGQETEDDEISPEWEDLNPSEPAPLVRRAHGGGRPRVERDPDGECVERCGRKAREGEPRCQWCRVDERAEGPKTTRPRRPCASCGKPTWAAAGICSACGPNTVTLCSRCQRPTKAQTSVCRACHAVCACGRRTLNASGQCRRCEIRSGARGKVTCKTCDRTTEAKSGFCAYCQTRERNAAHPAQTTTP